MSAGCGQAAASHPETVRIGEAHPAYHVWRSRGAGQLCGAWYGTRLGVITAAMEAAGVRATVVAETPGELDDMLTQQDQLAAAAR